MATETSRKAYRELKDLGNRQRLVYAQVKYSEAFAAGRSDRLPSNADIARALDLPINEITPRTSELRRLGWIRVHGKKRDCVTQKLVQTLCTADPNDKKLIDIFADKPAAEAVAASVPGEAVRWMDD